MGATRRDLSGVFDAELKGRRTQKAAVLDKAFHLTHKGITFVTDTFWPEWTEVGVEMRLPSKGARRDQQIMCRGVVVQCTRREQGNGFEVSLLFLDLPKRAQSQLSVIPPSVSPVSISISR
jgi:hypothetical protein